MGKTTAEQGCVHLVKHGISLLLLGIPPKLFFWNQRWCERIGLVFGESKMLVLGSVWCSGRRNFPPHLSPGPLMLGSRLSARPFEDIPKASPETLKVKSRRGPNIVEASGFSWDSWNSKFEFCEGCGFYFNFPWRHHSQGLCCERLIPSMLTGTLIYRGTCWSQNVHPHLLAINVVIISRMFKGTTRNSFFLALVFWKRGANFGPDLYHQCHGLDRTFWESHRRAWFLPWMLGVQLFSQWKTGGSGHIVLLGSRASAILSISQDVKTNITSSLASWDEPDVGCQFAVESFKSTPVPTGYGSLNCPGHVVFTLRTTSFQTAYTEVAWKWSFGRLLRCFIPLRFALKKRLKLVGNQWTPTWHDGKLPHFPVSLLWIAKDIGQKIPQVVVQSITAQKSELVEAQLLFDKFVLNFCHNFFTNCAFYKFLYDSVSIAHKTSNPRHEETTADFSGAGGIGRSSLGELLRLVSRLPIFGIMSWQIQKKIQRPIQNWSQTIDLIIQLTGESACFFQHPFHGSGTQVLCCHHMFVKSEKFYTMAVGIKETNCRSFMETNISSRDLKSKFQRKVLPFCPMGHLTNGSKAKPPQVQRNVGRRAQPRTREPGS